MPFRHHSAGLLRKVWRHYGWRCVPFQFGSAALGPTVTAPACEGMPDFPLGLHRRSEDLAIPVLDNSARRLTHTTGAKFNPRRVAILELEWSQERRELVPPEKYARILAQLGQEIYSRRQDPLIDAAALERAEAVAFRDSHRQSEMSESDWNIVAEKLTRSYRLLHGALIDNHPSGNH